MLHTVRQLQFRSLCKHCNSQSTALLLFPSLANLQYLAGSFTDENILEAQPEKVCAAVALLRRAAVQFAATLDQVRYLTITAQ
jgi:hypothetical protein